MLDDDFVFNQILSKAPISDTCFWFSWDHGRSIKEVESEDEGISLETESDPELLFEKNTRSGCTYPSAPSASCQEAFLMWPRCATLCMPYWTKPIGNQGKSNIHWDTSRRRPRSDPQADQQGHIRANKPCEWMGSGAEIQFSLENMNSGGDGLSGCPQTCHAAVQMTVI